MEECVFLGNYQDGIVEKFILLNKAFNIPQTRSQISQTVPELHYFNFILKSSARLARDIATTDLSHITTQMWEIPVLQIAH